MARVILPKELALKQKWMGVNIISIGGAFGFIGYSLLMLDIFHMTGFIKNFVYLPLLWIVTLALTIPIPRFGNSWLLLLNSIKFLYAKHKKNNYIILNKDKVKKDIVDKNGKVKQKILETKLSNDQRIDRLFYDLKIHEIVYNDKVNYIRYSNGHVSTYLELTIDEIPLLQTEQQRNISMDSFHDVLKSFSKFRLFTINTQMDYNRYMEYLDAQALRNPIYEKFYGLKKWQIKNAENIIQIQYYVEVYANDFEELKQLIGKASGKSNFNAFVLNKTTFDSMLQHQIYSLLDFIYEEEYTVNESSDKYISFITLDYFQPEQNYYFLTDLFRSDFDVSINLKEVLSAENTVRSAESEISTRGTLNKMDARKINNSLRQIDNIGQRLLDGDVKLFNMELIVKIDGSTKEELIFQKNKFLTYFKKLGVFHDGYFRQNTLCRSFYSFPNDSNYNYIVPSISLAQSYPFNFTSLIQQNGLLRNATRSSILFLDTLNIDSKTGQNSYDKIICANKGAGKSVEVKQDALDTLALQNGQVIMIDFEGEAHKLVKSFDGDYIQMGNTKLNLLYIAANPTNDVILSSHIEDVITFYELVYGEFRRELRIDFSNLLISLYNKFGVNKKTIDYGNCKFPKMSDLKTLAIDMDMNEISKIVSNFMNAYGDMCNESDSNRGLKFNNRFTAIGFKNTKDNEKIFNAQLFWMIKNINHKIRFNKIDTETFDIDVVDQDGNNLTEVQKQEMLKLNLRYIEIYLETNDLFINTELVNKFNYLSSNLTKENIILMEKYLKSQWRFIRVIIDESHRVSELPAPARFMLKMTKESRKFGAGLTLVDHYPATFIDGKNDLKAEMWGLIPYRVLLYLDRVSINKLIKHELITELQATRIDNPQKGQGIILLGKKVFDYSTKVSDEFIDIFDGGK